MRKLRHVLSGAIYESEKPGFVRVDKNGVSGLFREDGTWISGELKMADQHMCNWVGGRSRPNRGAPMRQVRHYTGALYENDGEGLVRVDEHGVVGVFREDGTWISGELKMADPDMCKWVGGYQEEP